MYVAYTLKIRMYVAYTFKIRMYVAYTFKIRMYVAYTFFFVKYACAENFPVLSRPCSCDQMYHALALADGCDKTCCKNDFRWVRIKRPKRMNSQKSVHKKIIKSYRADKEILSFRLEFVFLKYKTCVSVLHASYRRTEHVRPCARPLRSRDSPNHSMNFSPLCLATHFFCIFCVRRGKM